MGVDCQQTLTDVEFLSKLPIPRLQAGDWPLLLFCDLDQTEQDGKAYAFTIRSCSSRDPSGESPTYVEHCRGHVIKNGDHLLTPDGEIRQCRRPRGHGLMDDVVLEDLGEEGLRRLIERHSDVPHDSRESFYGAFTGEGRNEYGPAMANITELRVDPTIRSVLGRLEFDNSSWAAEGGCLAPELVDSLTHVGLYHADQNIICYAGGFEAAYILRQPATPIVYSLYLPDESMVQVREVDVLKGQCRPSVMKMVG